MGNGVGTQMVLVAGSSLDDDGIGRGHFGLLTSEGGRMRNMREDDNV